MSEEGRRRGGGRGEEEPHLCGLWPHERGHVDGGLEAGDAAHAALAADQARAQELLELRGVQLGGVQALGGGVKAR